MRKNKTPITVKTKRTYSQKPDPRPKPTVIPKPTGPVGPDYEGPYSIKGTAGPVSEKVSKVRDIINGTSSPIPYQKKGGAMKKLGCAQCGKSMSKGGAKKMNLGGSAIKKAPTYMYGMPQENMGQAGQYGIAKKGGIKKSFPDMSGDGKVTAKDILMAKGVIKKPKAKFGATVKVQRSPKAGKVRSAGDQGYAAVGQREPGRVIKRTLSKKEDGGPVTSRKLTRLGTKIEKKTTAGKTVGKGLQKRYDKAVDKVIVKGMTKKK